MGVAKCSVSNVLVPRPFPGLIVRGHFNNVCKDMWPLPKPVVTLFLFLICQNVNNSSVKRLHVFFFNGDTQHGRMIVRMIWPGAFYRHLFSVRPIYIPIRGGRLALPLI